MKPLPAWGAIREALAGSRERFEAAARYPRRVQREQLASILLRDGIADFHSMPIRRYEEIAPIVVRSPIAFERTGGSSGGWKLIPFTAESLAAIQRAIFVWLDDLLGARPGIMQGRAYWSISPAVRGGGFGSDAAYFGPVIGGHISSLLAVPPSVAQLGSMDEWREATLAALCEADDLTMMSVWSPTFLLELLRDVPVAGLWPVLDTISCWTDASSRRFAMELAARFPGVYMQGKGLLATEGVITIPIEGCAYPVLAIESGFFEFVDDLGRVLLCDELSVGAEYQVVMTTHAGLYRYAIGDRVRMQGWFHRTPMLEFLGRDGAASDLCGEKLTDAFVAGALVGVEGFAMLAPDGVRYVLYLDEAVHSPEAAARVAFDVDERLGLNPQYRYARDLRQLGGVESVRIREPLQRFYRQAADRKLGDIKVPALGRLL